MAPLRIPALGVGTWELREPALTPALRAALRAGCRHIDCAAVYENEAEVGAALAALLPELGLRREDLFVTSKLWCTMFRPEDVPRALDATLANLRTAYVDLYLVHWPFSFRRDPARPVDACASLRDSDGRPVLDDTPLAATWAAMERLCASGKARAVGVSNFDVPHLRALLETARVPPAANQIEMHPYLPQERVRAFCVAHGIVPVAYSPLGSRGVLGEKHRAVIEDDAVVRVAKRLGRTPAQVLLGWALARGTPAIPKTARPERMAENMAAQALAPADAAEVSAGAAARVRYCDPVDFWGLSCFEHSE